MRQANRPTGQQANRPTDFIIAVVNFTPVPRRDYRLGVPAAGDYVELLNSDADVYGGSNIGNQGRVYSRGKTVARLRVVAEPDRPTTGISPAEISPARHSPE